MSADRGVAEWVKRVVGVTNTVLGGAPNMCANLV